MKERKEKKNWVLIAFMVFIMIGTTFSFVFFGFSSAPEKVNYEGIKFMRKNNVWTARIYEREAAFTFLPSEVSEISAADFSNKLQNKLEIDTTSDINSTFKVPIALAQHQMGLTLAAYNVYLRKGFTTNNSFNLPIITCNDATEAVPVVYFKYGNSTGIYVENNCIIAESSSEAGFIMAKDRLLYGILGVIK